MLNRLVLAIVLLLGGCASLRGQCGAGGCGPGGSSSFGGFSSGGFFAPMQMSPLCQYRQNFVQPPMRVVVPTRVLVVPVKLNPVVKKFRFNLFVEPTYE